VDFAQIDGFDWATAVTREDTRGDYGERRFLSTGLIEGRLHVCIWTVRAEGMRLISLRKRTQGKGCGMTGRKSYIDENGDALELDEAWFREAVPTSELPELLERLRRQGRPALPEEDRKKRVTLYLDPDVLACLKAEGKGWQTRANAALRRALGL
jgi:uncharacterized protein (DUF4415 family)